MHTIRGIASVLRVYSLEIRNFSKFLNIFLGKQKCYEFYNTKMFNFDIFPLIFGRIINFTAKIVGIWHFAMDYWRISILVIHTQFKNVGFSHFTSDC